MSSFYGNGGGSGSSIDINNLFDLSDRLAKGTYTDPDTGEVSEVPGAVIQGAVKVGVEYDGTQLTQDQINVASGIFSHAEGYITIASGYASHAEGDGTEASGESSHAEGDATEASGNYSHTEGSGTIASGYASHAEGRNTEASGRASHAEGIETTASGSYSHAEGQYTIASHLAQHVFGMYNITDPSSAESNEKGTYVQIVGNGDDNQTSNARTLDWSGNEKLAGSLTLGMGTQNETTITAAQLASLKELIGIESEGF